MTTASPTRVVLDGDKPQPSNVPAAARRQIDAANRMIADQRAANAAAAPPAELPQLAEVTIAPPASAQPPESVTTPPKAADFETKYKVLQGKYNSETSVLRQQLAQKDELLNKVLDRPAPTAPPAAPAPARKEDTFKQLGVTDKELDEYGADLVQLMARVADGTATPAVRALVARIEKIEQQTVANTTKIVAKSQADILAELDSTFGASKWRTVNESPDFLAWLDRVDVFSGTSRRVALTHAFNNLEAARVVGIFNAYLKEDSAIDLALPDPEPSVQRETLIAPGQPRAASAEAPGGQGKRIWSESEISDFYSRVRKRQISKDEYDSINSEIAAAVTEGRVKPTRRDIHSNNR